MAGDSGRLPNRELVGFGQISRTSHAASSAILADGIGRIYASYLGNRTNTFEEVSASIYHTEMMSVLPEQTIPAGVHVLLDIRAGSLRIVGATGMSVICVEYVIRDQDIALEFFGYLQWYRKRFASVHIK